MNTVLYCSLQDPLRKSESTTNTVIVSDRSASNNNINHTISMPRPESPVPESEILFFPAVVYRPLEGNRDNRAKDFFRYRSQTI